MGERTEIKAVIWDFGGVVVRTDNRAPRTALADRLGLTYAQLDEIVFNSQTAQTATVGSIPVEQHWQSVLARLGLPPEALDEFFQGFWGGDLLDEDLIAYISGLRPRLRTGLLSNAWSDLRWQLEQRWRIVSAFDELIISAEVGIAKPDERIYWLALQRLGVSPGEAVFIDDFPANIEGARKVGLNVIRFLNSTQAKADLEKMLDGQGS